MPPKKRHTDDPERNNHSITRWFSPSKKSLEKQSVNHTKTAEPSLVPLPVHHHHPSHTQNSSSSRNHQKSNPHLKSTRATVHQTEPIRKSARLNGDGPSERQNQLLQNTRNSVSARGRRNQSLPEPEANHNGYKTRHGHLRAHSLNKNLSTSSKDSPREKPASATIRQNSNPSISNNPSPPNTSIPLSVSRRKLGNIELTNIIESRTRHGGKASHETIKPVVRDPPPPPPRRSMATRHTGVTNQHKRDSDSKETPIQREKDHTTRNHEKFKTKSNEQLHALPSSQTPIQSELPLIPDSAMDIEENKELKEQVLPELKKDEEPAIRKKTIRFEKDEFGLGNTFKRKFKVITGSNGEPMATNVPEFKIENPKYQFLLEEEQLSDTEYIFDKARPQTMHPQSKPKPLPAIAPDFEPEPTAHFDFYFQNNHLRKNLIKPKSNATLAKSNPTANKNTTKQIKPKPVDVTANKAPPREPVVKLIQLPFIIYRYDPKKNNKDSLTPGPQTMVITEGEKLITQAPQISEAERAGKRFLVPVKLCSCCGFNGKRHLCEHNLCSKPCSIMRRKNRIRDKYLEKYRLKKGMYAPDYQKNKKLAMMQQHQEQEDNSMDEEEEGDEELESDEEIVSAS